MFDVITFGSGTQDIFLKLNKSNYSLLERGKLLAFPVGEKLLVSEMHIESGGGGTNSAVTFALQDLSVAWVGKVGLDKAGQALLQELRRFNVDTRFVKCDQKEITAVSVILSPETEDRIIFINRGACHCLEKNDIPWKAIKKAKWFYIAPLYEDFSLLQEIIEFAYFNKIKIALNPSKQHLKENKEQLRKLSQKVSVLLLNQQEAEILASGKFFEVLRPKKGILVVTKGEKGSTAYLETGSLEIPSQKVKVVELTGAGDAFGSGLVAALIKGKEVRKALIFATQNAVGCIQELGAKKGLRKL